MYALGALIVAGFILVTMFFLYRQMPEPNREILLILIGVWGAKFGDVIGYFFGTSKSSAEKNEMLYKSTPTESNGNNQEGS